MPTKDGGPAWPEVHSRLEETSYGGRDPQFRAYSTGGMSLRDWFAGQALAGMLAHAGAGGGGAPWFAAQAYDLADAMLAQREQK